MQYNHQFYGYPIFKQNDYVPWFPSPTCMPAPVACPEVVGEGEVTSMMYPDGSQQYFFLPKNFGTGPYFYKNNSIWLIRSICLPNYNQQNNFDTPMSCQPACCYPTNEKSTTGFQLKFHNDTETSTTDLHYFFPCLRTCEWVPRLAASVQAELPTESPAMNNYQGSCNKPCNCNNAVNAPKPMSVDNASETNMKEPNIKIECQCKEYEERNAKKKSMSNKRISFFEKKSIVTCECDKPDNTVKETPTCKCHGEESNAREYKCKDAEQKSAELCDKYPTKSVIDRCQCNAPEYKVEVAAQKSTEPSDKYTKQYSTTKPVIDRCQCKTAMEKDKSKHKCLCRSASVCPSCRNKNFLKLRRPKCKKSSSSSAVDKPCKCECHMDTDKKNGCDENCDVSGNSSENTVTDDASSSRTSLCDACSSLCDWYNYLFSKAPPGKEYS